MKKIQLKYFIVLFGFFTLIIRLFYFKLDEIFGVRFLDFTIILILILTLVLLVLVIIKALRKEFKPLIFLIIIISVMYFVPFDYLVGLTKFNLNAKDREELVFNLKNGAYDDRLQYPENLKHGTWIENHEPRFKVYKNSEIQMIFYWQGYIRTHEEFCGQLYLSDVKKIDNIVVGEFLGRSYRKIYLGENWFWVDCYVERSPGP